MGIFDIYLLEALINGVLLGGVLALLSLGLNLIFGVIDVVWICYAELIMLGMYGMYFLYSVYHVPSRGRRRHLHRRRRRPRRAPARAGDRAAARRRAHQPAPGHRRRAVLPAVGGDRDVRHRVQEPRHAPAGAEAVRHVHQLLAPAGLRRRAGRHGARLSVPHPDLHGHGHPRHRPGPPDHAADGRGQPPDLPHHLGARRRRWPASPPACWCCSTTSIRSSACRSARSPS